ncbi:MAG: NADH-quinone oxidoreductase subunit C [Candidatus Omnitrophica bacterium]|nr:NADH-quinone oxidoreductase subunit C [Candidatus Omnitrophota bacterium]MBU1924240.1 NADH-quinone oxidoreductase subunit C [Candidatus Omnitrophota bacterium]
MFIADEIKERLDEKIIDWYQHSSRRIYFSVEPKYIQAVAGLLFRDLGLRFSIATGQDTPQGLELLYHFSFDKTGEIISVRVLIKDKKKPEIDSLAPLFPAAEWIEREMWEMLGINFIGHPNLKRLLLADEWPEGKHPLRHEDES